MPRPLNYTTKIGAKRTAGECIDLLADAGASHVAVSYTDRQPDGLSFTLHTRNGLASFVIPIEVEAMRAVLVKMLRTDPPHVSRAELSRLGSTAHARDVAWRVIRDWLEAVLAKVAAELTTLDQEMLPYLRLEDGRILAQAYRDGGPPALPAGVLEEKPVQPPSPRSSR